MSREGGGRGGGGVAPSGSISYREPFDSHKVNDDMENMLGPRCLMTDTAEREWPCSGSACHVHFLFVYVVLMVCFSTPYLSLYHW